MKIVKIIGGLGNQMFQYALAIALKERWKDEEIKLDLHGFNGYHKHQGYQLDMLFGHRFEAATLTDVAQLAWPYPHYQLWRVGSRLLPKRRSMLCEPSKGLLPSDVLKQKGSLYYDGYWQDERYFKAIRPRIMAAFKFPDFTDRRNLETEKRLKASEAVSIHIRRGDYLDDVLFQGTCDIAYYQRAIARLCQLKTPVFCIFSNDMAWCKVHIEPLLHGKEILYVDWNRGKESYRDLQLMTLCRHHIIANSSFSWWGAWLSKADDGITIAPQHWYAHDAKPSPAAERWIKV